MIEEEKRYRLRCDVCGDSHTCSFFSKEGMKIVIGREGWTELKVKVVEYHACPECNLTIDFCKKKDAELNKNIDKFLRGAKVIALCIICTLLSCGRHCTKKLKSQRRDYVEIINHADYQVQDSCTNCDQ